MASKSIHEAAGAGDLDAVKILVQQDPTLVNQDDQYEWRPIFHAALRRQYEVVAYLIDQGADLSAHDGYVMHYAGEVPNNKEILSLLVAYGGLDGHTEPDGELARQFIYAVFLANTARVRAMLGVNSELVNKRYARGDQALHHASRNGDLEIAKVLLEFGADVNALTENDHFPLYCAAGHGHVETTRFFVENGADLQVRIGGDKTVVDWLKQYADDKRLKACLDVLER